MISFIIPAHNEEELIGRGLKAIHESVRDVGEDYEVIVVNDSSTDKTGVIAAQHCAQVLQVSHRQIAATRNSGARVAKGDIFIFVDGDTMVTPRAVRAAVRAVRNGAVGGGCTVRFDGPVPFYASVLERVLPMFMQLLSMAAGCFLFCRRDAYFLAGGFDEELFCTEEVGFGNRLKRYGQFIVLRQHVITSARKLRTRTVLELLQLGFQMARGGGQARRRREGLEYWYGPR